MKGSDRILVALDVSDLGEVNRLADVLGSCVGGFKVGLELSEAVGTPAAIGVVRNRGIKVFRDGKYDDIPNTVGKATREASRLGAHMINVHASAGIDSMIAAVANRGEALILAVTVLTSFEENAGHLVFGAPTKAKVLQLARDAKLAGCQGIICSPQELSLLAKRPELKGMLFVTPGVRPAGSDMNDQKRVMTPGEAIKAGADYLVIGRPITSPKDMTPREAAEAIAIEIEAALFERDKS